MCFFFAFIWCNRFLCIHSKHSIQAAAAAEEDLALAEEEEEEEEVNTGSDIGGVSSFLSFFLSSVCVARSDCGPDLIQLSFIYLF